MEYAMEILFKLAVVVFIFFMGGAFICEALDNDSVRRLFAMPAAQMLLFLIVSALILIPYYVFFIV